MHCSAIESWWGGRWHGRRKQQQLSLLSPWWSCWPGSLPPPNPISHSCTLFLPLTPSNLALTWAEVRSREKGVSVFIHAIAHIWGEWFADCLSGSYELTGLMISPFSKLTSSAELPVCLCVCPRHRFWSHFYVWLCLSFCLSPFSHSFRPSIHSSPCSCQHVLISFPFEWGGRQRLDKQSLAQIWEEQTAK